MAQGDTTMLTDVFELMFAYQYCYWVRMMNAHLDVTGDILETIPT